MGTSHTNYVDKDYSELAMKYTKGKYFDKKSKGNMHSL